MEKKNPCSWRSFPIAGVGPKSNGICPLKKKAEENLRQTEEENADTHKGESNVKGAGRDSRDVAATQGMPRTAGSRHPKAEEAENGVSFRASGKSAVLSTPSFQIAGLQNCKRIKFYSFKPPNLW